MDEDYYLSGLETAAHVAYDVYYHIVWVPKYRRRVLGGDVGRTAERVIRDVCERYGYRIDTLGVHPDHVHLLVSIPPKNSIAEAVRTIKSITAKTLFEQHPEVKQHLWKGTLWATGYFAKSIGSLDRDAVRNYIMSEQEP
jgi:putative transposase